MTTETTLTAVDQAEVELMLANADLGVAGEENLQPGDIGMPPRLQISQQNRPIEIGDEEVPPGSIVNTLTGETYESVEVVPLVFLPRTRVMWPDSFDVSNDPVCVSDNGNEPLSSDSGRVMTNPQRGPCVDCPYALFGPDGEAPRCKMQRNFLVMIVETGEPAILTMQSTALTAAKQFTSLAKTQGVRKGIRFMTQKVKGDQGQWYVPAFAKGAKLDPPQLVQVIEARDDLKNLIITADIEARTNGHHGDDLAVAGDYENGNGGPITDETIPF